MKKRFSLAMAVLMVALLIAGCSSAKTDEDWAYIQKKGTMVIGITIYNPMNYYDDKNELIGFDTEFAKALCAKLGVEAQFQVIDWDAKETELKSKNIDAIWNGLTVTEGRKENMDFSLSYIANRQVAVIQAAKADVYKDSTQTMAGAKVAAEGQSAGEAAVQADAVLKDSPYTAMPYQADVLLEVKSGTVDIGVIDAVMAKASIGEGTDYSDLMIVPGVDLASEEYAIGLRKGSTETLEKVNAAMQQLAGDGTLKAIAEKYDLTEQMAFEVK